LDLSKDISDAGVIATSLWLNSNLKEMSLWDCENITNLSVIALTKGANNLESLSLASCNKITDISIASISSCLPKLRKLYINGLGNVTDSGFSHLANGCLQNLHELNISFCAITEVGITSISNGNLHNLRVLNMTNCNMCSSQSLKALANGNLTQLRELYMGPSMPHMGRTMTITDEGLECLGSGNLSNLEVLDINYGQYTGTGLAKMAHGLPSLLSLRVRQHKLLTDADIALTAIFTTLVNLKSLCISECDATDAGLEILNDAVGNNVKFALSSLTILGSKIGNIGIKAISSALTELKQLDLGYSEISDSGLHALGGSCFLQLQSLNLSGCREITDDGVVALLNKLKRMTSLVMSNTKIGDRGIIAAFTESKCLKYLDISDTNITDDGLITAIKKSNGTPLKALVMFRVKEVTDLGLGALVFGLRSLEKLGISGVSWFINDHHRYTEGNLEKIKQHFPELLL
jgi:hypothetical protein